MSNPQHEPTMEEILASIRKIISEDTPDQAPETPDAPLPEQAFAPPPPEPAPQPPVHNPIQNEPIHDDVLELTQEIAAPAPQPESVPEPLPAEPVHDVVFEPVAPEPAPAPAATGDIFSDTTRRAMDDVFAAIPDADEAPVQAPAATMASVDAATVETVFERAVRGSFEPVLKTHLAENSAAIIEGMKPLIREWMDEHFPALLEGAVRAEVERVVKARGKR